MPINLDQHWLLEWYYSLWKNTIQNWQHAGNLYPKPKNTKAVQRSLGAANVYSHLTSVTFAPHSPIYLRKTPCARGIVSATTSLTRFAQLWHKTGYQHSRSFEGLHPVLQRFSSRFWGSTKASWRRQNDASHCVLLKKAFQAWGELCYYRTGVLGRCFFCR